MSDKDKRFVLIDAMAMLYRGYFALVKSPRLTTKGVNTSAVFVVTNVLFDLIKKLEPTHIVMALDTPEPTHRHKIYEEYKANRDKIPEDLIKSIEHLKMLCEAMNITALTCPGWEADDIVGTLTLKAEKSNFTSFMVTPDKDYAQLVSPKTYLYKPAYRGGGFDQLGVEEILKDWEIREIPQVIDVLGLMGDASDNIPGVPGVGKKTAQKLLAQYGSVENLLKNTDQLKGKLKEKIENNTQQALQSKDLVRIDRKAPVKIRLTDLKYKHYDEDKLKKLFKELEFNTLGKRLFGGGYEAEIEALQDKESDEAVITLKDRIYTYSLVKTEKDRQVLLKNLFKQKSVCFDIESTGIDPKICEPLGIAFSWKPRKAFYLVLSPEEKPKILEDFKPFFEDNKIEKIGHNIKYDISLLKWQGIDVRGSVFDTMIAAFLTMPHLKRSMDSLAEEFLKYRPIPITQLIGEKGKDQLNMIDLSPEEIKDYACEDADITLQLSEVFRLLIEDHEQEKLFYDIESPLINTLVDMEHQGVALDLEAMNSLSEELSAYIEKTKRTVFKLAGEEFQLNSPKQLGEVLFDKMKLDPKAKRTQKSKQYSTNEQTLIKLQSKHQIIEEILNYRSFTKLKSTYVDALPSAILAKTGKIHTSFEQTLSASGRLQSNNPNLQNIPIKSAMGKEVRKAFVPQNKDYLILSADYSQIELRIAAEFSKDPGLIKAFKENKDIHTATAMEIFDELEKNITREMRSKAKMVNFGILYGISAFGLSQRLNIPRFEASDLIDTYFIKYQGIRNYLNRTIEFAKAHGYVETLSGRRRYVRDINSQNNTVQKAAERVAINAPIQGTAADMIKIAMKNIHDEFGARKLKSKMILQVHDELVFDMHKKEKKVVQEIVERSMTEAIPMEVPLLVDIGVGENWLEAH